LKDPSKTKKTIDGRGVGGKRSRTISKTSNRSRGSDQKKGPSKT